MEDSFYEDSDFCIDEETQKINNKFLDLNKKIESKWDDEVSFGSLNIQEYFNDGQEWDN